MAVKVLRRISQETFDECVQGNIDDFEMGRTRRREAVKEFELQGVDLSQIHKWHAGPEGRGEHPAARHARLRRRGRGGSPNVTAAIAAGVSLRAEITGDDAVPGWGAAGVRAGAVQAAARLCESVAARANPTRRRSPPRSTPRAHSPPTKRATRTPSSNCPARSSTSGPRAPRTRTTTRPRLRVPRRAAASTRCEACKGAFVEASAEVPSSPSFATASTPPR